MVAKSRKGTQKKVKDLPAESLMSKQAKRVKGGKHIGNVKYE